MPSISSSGAADPRGLTCTGGPSRAIDRANRDPSRHRSSRDDGNPPLPGRGQCVTVGSGGVAGDCLHCGAPPIHSGVQVSCDDCRSYICNGCHWCHEFQANHEIRVCDRCDAFYCRSCDEMDQCEDCSEVVCGNCSTLMSCKFCGCGLCEDCATACGR
mmetsp:Transcript_16769/g.37704  ORF Transcript_16769/g.37704 Transcript_16769/m.37704 type:complete len:158 (-) Transcript_16769:371-844(-)